MKLSLVVIRCKDIDVSKEFYERLGLQFIKEKHGNGPEHYSSEYECTVFELYPSNEKPTDNTRLGFQINNLEVALQALTISSEYKFNGKTIYVVVDPDGRKVEISE